MVYVRYDGDIPNFGHEVFLNFRGAKVTIIYCINRISFEPGAKRSSKATVYHFITTTFFVKTSSLENVFPAHAKIYSKGRTRRRLPLTLSAATQPDRVARPVRVNEGRR
jgi:hypothetical protein